MAQYLGFSTKNSCLPKTTNPIIGDDGGPGGTMTDVIWGKKFQLNDTELVIQDFINALSIRKGTKVGQPGYGSILLDFVFEPNVADLQFNIESEIRRVAAQDSRIILNRITPYASENGILIEVEMAVAPFNIPTTASIYADSLTETISQR